MKHWILPITTHESNIYLFDDDNTVEFVIAPNRELKRGDTVYLWWNPHDCFTGWGIVAETPMDFIEEDDDRLKKRGRPRRRVSVNRVKPFSLYISKQMMSRDRHLKHMIPPVFEVDLFVIPLRPVQAAYLNDYIREHNLEAPKESVTTRWTIPDNAPQVTMMALLTLGDKTKEGQLVEGVRLPWYTILEIINRDPEEIYQMDPRRFEELIAGAYEKDGYDEVILTPRSGDRGRDIVATKYGVGTIRIFDQVKRYKISRPVTAEEVRALVGVITMASNVSKGIITTTSTFAPNLLDDEDVRRVIPYRLELKPRNVLLPWLEGLRLG